jgi:hypothetical protein
LQSLKLLALRMAPTHQLQRQKQQYEAQCLPMPPKKQLQQQHMNQPRQTEAKKGRLLLELQRQRK